MKKIQKDGRHLALVHGERVEKTPPDLEFMTEAEFKEFVADEVADAIDRHLSEIFSENDNLKRQIRIV